MTEFSFGTSVSDRMGVLLSDVRLGPRDALGPFICVYLASFGPATAREIADALGRPIRKIHQALNLLQDKRLVFKDVYRVGGVNRWHIVRLLPEEVENARS